MKIEVGYSEKPNSVAAGYEAATIALRKAGRSDPCDLVLLFCTARHDQRVLREAVTAVTGDHGHIYGGGTVGVITNHHFGYAGDQVGVACFWLEGSCCEAFVESNLHKGEANVGESLGKRLAAQGVTPDTPAMLFYDAIDRTQGDLSLLMATWLLEGIEKGLGFLPDLAGAGFQGDHIGSPTYQFTGDGMEDHCAMALTFSDDIRIDTTIMHGCRPASPYYTVTRAEGSTILEINGEPALPFMDKLLGPAIAPENYPFFLILGINHGEPWGAYDENDYASRLCLGIDTERNGIVMFEPDMVEGTEFQVMYRALDLDYMKPKIEEAFNRLGDREPLFVMYLDCAGRCAGYGGEDLEDALVVQEAIKNRVPLLGLYTGVEIAPMGGRSRGLDWTGVFCLFSKGKPEPVKRQADAWSKKKKNASGTDDIPIEALKALCEQNAARVLALDTKSIAIRHELEHKRRGFSLLAELSISLRQGPKDEGIFAPVTQRINAALNMQRTAVLFPDAEGRFIPSVLQGYPPEQKAALAGKQIPVAAELLDPENPVLVTAADSPHRLAELRQALRLPYFVSAPVIVKNEVSAIVITGRTVEETPFLSRLSRSDVETVQAISALLSSVLVYQQLDDANRRALLDGLTGLLNRGALEVQVMELLQNEAALGKHFAFIMIDFDHFKQVNDTYGHMEGDAALKALAKALQGNFRSTDIVARMGGDEFAVFCSLTGDVNQIARRVTRLMGSWSQNPLITETGAKIYPTLSIGISIAPQDGTTYNELFHKADIALYKAKQRGRNQYAIYDNQWVK